MNSLYVLEHLNHLDAFYAYLDAFNIYMFSSIYWLKY